jgi:NAD(P)-dependent dehydrogenase (short-subunit alcohol dehydrogenase family)
MRYLKAATSFRHRSNVESVSSHFCFGKFLEATVRGVRVVAAAGGVAAMAWLLSKRRNYDFAGKVVLITGGSRGLGLVLARQFISERAKVAICARDDEELADAQVDLESRAARDGFTAEVLTVKCDVAEREQVENLMRRIHDRFGPVDVLINNAGVIQVGPVEVMTREDFENALKVHFWGPLNTILSVLPNMRSRKEGRIVNISSIGGKISVPHLVPYSASKFALVGLSEGLQAELLKDGICVTTVCPGMMRTGSPRNADFKGKHRAEYAWFSILDSLPLTSISAERAARQIVEACRRGQAELIISIQAKAAVLFHGVFPGLTAELLGIMDRLLPGPGGIGSQTAKGKESGSAVSPSWITTLTEHAAARNNEVAT